MRKFNIRKVLDGLTAVSAVASASSAAQQQQAGNRETEIQETLQSEHFQLCKKVNYPYAYSHMVPQPYATIQAM
ncbi:syntaxin-binding protein 5-like protein [Turdus rufiventris]|nr:syntaxin-binding protein 5-like protein [Turdus rufiventris]